MISHHSLVHFISYSKFYMLFDFIFLEFLSCILCVVIFNFQVMNLELGSNLLLPQIILVCVFRKSFCFHNFGACDNQKDRNITFMGANTQWTSSPGVNEKRKKDIQSTNCNLAMCTFSPKVLCTFFIFITLINLFLKYSKLRVLDPNLSKIRDQIESQDENNT
jgi:hypothetical protein